MALLARSEHGVLSTVSADGTPYGVSLNYCLLNSAIYFHCALEGHKLDNIDADCRVSFCVVGDTKVLPDKFSTCYESVIVAGRASETHGEEKQKALEFMVARFSGQYFPEGLRYIEANSGKTRVFRIAIDAVSGKTRRG